MGFQNIEITIGHPLKVMFLFNILCGKVVPSGTSCSRTLYVDALPRLMTSTRTRLIMAHSVMNRAAHKITTNVSSKNVL